ncbi:MAG TPA: hypothetical protein VJT73_21235, partial [Polyangiaceae bacterium]|nr:hypothetical protein [Polyangiaceae bacterium]
MDRRAAGARGNAGSCATQEGTTRSFRAAERTREADDASHPTPLAIPPMTTIALSSGDVRTLQWCIGGRRAANTSTTPGILAA